MGRKADYPQWVTERLKKGQYVNKKGDSYYVYSAHSERREGIDHPVRVCDGYLGRITERDGFIPSRKKPSGTVEPELFTPSAWNYGIIIAVFCCSDRILQGLRITYRRYGTFVYICSVLSFLYGMYSNELYMTSTLSLLLSDVPFPEEVGDSLSVGIDRGSRMLSEAVNKTYGEDWPKMRAYLASSVLLKNKRGYTLAPLPPSAYALARKYDLPFSKEQALRFLREHAEN
ncbi:MAG: hypothetical protein IJP84_09570 [Lachnospiraceae bacterium]|nr:hypothetical protein [Lachnospiraceae bacterium]